MPRSRPLLASSLLALTATCGEDPAPPPVAVEPRTDAAVDAEQDDEDLDFDALATLGYVDFGEEVVEPGSPSGVVLRDAQRSWPGYDLVTSLPTCRAVLYSPAGEAVREWSFAPAREVQRVELLPNGDLVAVGIDRARDEGLPDPDSPHLSAEERELLRRPFLLRTTFEGELLWRREIDAHHDFDVSPAGHLAVLTSRVRKPGGRHRQNGIVDHGVSLLNTAGELVSVVSGYKVFAASPDIIRLRGKPNDAGRPADVLHLNSIEWMTRPELAARNPLFDLGNVLLCSRHQSAIFMLDWRERELVWAWRDDSVALPHEATVTDAGRILLFDNGSRDRGHARVVEVDPLSGEITWEWTAPEPESFRSVARGQVQGLPGGNVLVTSSAQGVAFELTRAGEVVWRFENPDLNTEGRRAIMRLKRYDPAFIEPLLGRRR